MDQDDNLTVRLDACFKVIRIHLEIVGLTIDENYSRARVDTGRGGSHKGMTREKNCRVAHVDCS